MFFDLGDSKMSNYEKQIEYLQKEFKVVRRVYLNQIFLLLIVLDNENYKGLYFLDGINKFPVEIIPAEFLDFKIFTGFLDFFLVKNNVGWGVYSFMRKELVVDCIYSKNDALRGFKELRDFPSEENELLKELSS